MVKNGYGAVIGQILDQHDRPMKYLLIKLYERGTTQNEPYCQVETSPNGKFWCRVLPGQYYVWFNLKDWKNVNVEVFAGRYTNVTIDYAHYGPTSK